MNYPNNASRNISISSSPIKRTSYVLGTPESLRPHFQPPASSARPPSAKRPKFVEKSPISDAHTNSDRTGVSTQSFMKKLSFNLSSDLDEDSIGIQDNPLKTITENKNCIMKNDNRNELHKNSSSILRKETRPSTSGLASINEPGEISEHIYSVPSIITSTASSTSTNVYSSTESFSTSNVSCSPNWLESQHYLLKYLQTEQNLQASTLRDFLASHNLYIEKFNCSNKDQLELDLKLYVVAPRGTYATKPSEMPRAQLALCLEPCSTEEYLTKLCKSIRMRPELSSFEVDLHRGPWYHLANTIGREWVSYLFLHFHIFKPFEGLQGNWIKLVGSLRFEAGPKRTYGAKPTNSIDESSYVTKSDVMYKKRSLKREFQFPITGSVELESLHPHLRPLVTITEKRLTQYRKLLAKNCIPIPGTCSDKQRWTPQIEVARFLCHRLDKLVPLGILGSKGNRQKFYHAVKEFIKTPGFSKTALRPMLKGIKLKEVPWLRKKPGPICAGDMLDCIRWLFESIVKPLLIHHFYMTEMSGKPGSIYYFEQSLWSRVVEEPSKHLLIEKSQQGCHLNESIAANMSEHTQTKVYEDRHKKAESLRIVPKPDGSSRPIINLKEFNKGIKSAHIVLQHVMSQNLCRIDAWHSWVPRLCQYRERITEKEQRRPNFYIVKLDISGCYDNANIEKVMKTVKEVLDNGKDVYRLQSVKQFCLTSRKLQNRDIVSKLPEKADLSYLQSPLQWKRGSKEITTVITQNSKPSLLQGNDILNDIQNIFKGLNIRISKEKCIPFVNGIPQGSACSLDLCNLLLDDLVSTKLTEFTSDAQSILLRYVDDFLFVSTNKKLATRFRDRMLQGFEETYGVTCNPSKVVHNLDSEPPKNKIQFLGNNIDCKTLEVLPRSVPLHFNVRSNNLISIKRKLDYDMEHILSILRGFSREGKEPSNKLMHSVAKEFGRALVSRIDAFSAMYVHRSLSLQEVYQRVVNHYMMRLIPPRESKNIRRIIKQSYSRQLKKEISRNNIAK